VSVDADFRQFQDAGDAVDMRWTPSLRGRLLLSTLDSLLHKKLSYRWQTARCCFVKLLRYCRTFCQTRMVWLPDGEQNFQDIFDMIHERDRWTDRQADGRTHRHRMNTYIHNTARTHRHHFSNPITDRACIASRGKNASQHVPVYLQQFPSYSNRNCKKSPFLRTPAFIFCL